MAVVSFAALWLGMVIGVPAYMLAGGMIDQGLSARQAIGVVLLGNLVVLVPLLLIGHAGTRYGVPFAVLVRNSFGVQGAQVACACPRAGGVRMVWHPDVDALSQEHCVYRYSAGSNPIALITFAVPVLINLPGFLRRAAPAMFGKTIPPFLVGLYSFA